MEIFSTTLQNSPLMLGTVMLIMGLFVGGLLSIFIYRFVLMKNSSTEENDKYQPLLSTTHKLSNSADKTTKTVQKIKSINSSLVKITTKQYEIINQVFVDGEDIKKSLSGLVNKTDNSFLVLNETMDKMETEFSLIEESVHLFDNIKESTQSLSDVAHRTKILALNTAVLGASLGKDEKSINVIANEMQELVKTCQEASKHIENVVTSARDNVQTIVKTNREHIQATIENTLLVQQALQSLVALFKKNKSARPNVQSPSVDSIIRAVNVIEQLSNQVAEIVNEAKLQTEDLNNEFEVSNQIVSDLIGIVTNTPIINLSPVEAVEKLSNCHIIDVRRVDEFNDDLGHILSAKLCTINETSFKQTLLQLNRDAQYLFVCRSGGRSSKAARVAQAIGLSHIYNLEGGMLAWNKCNLPVE